MRPRCSRNVRTLASMGKRFVTEEVPTIVHRTNDTSGCTNRNGERLECREEPRFSLRRR